MTVDVRPGPGHRRSPLGATGPGEHPIGVSEGIELVEIPFLAQANLRLDPTQSALMAFEQRFGLRPPTTPNLRVTASSGLGAIWLAPDEWLVVAGGDAAALAADLESVVRPHRGTVVDVSGQRTTLRISGPRARDVLASGCSVDVHPRFFEVGQAAQTQLARVDVILTRVAGDEYQIFVRASFARYLADWLMDALGDEGGVL